MELLLLARPARSAHPRRLAPLVEVLLLEVLLEVLLEERVAAAVPLLLPSAFRRLVLSCVIPAHRILQLSG